jgi:hypothetical protein
MSDRTVGDTPDIPWLGTCIRSLEPVPGVGTWAVTGHVSCSGDGQLKALTPGEPAPLCQMCAAEVRWTLVHLAPTVAVDHQGADRLP